MRRLMTQGFLGLVLGEEALRDQGVGKMGRHGGRGILRPRPAGTTNPCIGSWGH
ncbi:Hypothetical protein AA314_02356 [Archangium gephyra]|uniref:Uncharacterized protein n=1 Tax=Archangium gephyra TaxID=48 RepID=A0AAC8Q410_9BACT|nr:Hypothetical protein AA314_02356 [Archangium gephyra]